ncbi:hypothetical protein ACFO4P_15395 [Epilithonimonas pallida]|uniref:Uncharacterized protein n=1 Tax=Epilithonimonas pallida TaxID=373671 RepID=A0ABY1R0F1_9FLAO|nr:hypothetical protein [Epilithonimonas pallida]SMP88094.1 hypothetical protein SAMN05421679_101411 [Epilithonimonas pallida]
MVVRFAEKISTIFRRYFISREVFSVNRTTYYSLPDKFRKSHDYCEFVINQIEELVLDDKFIQLKMQTFEFSEDVMSRIDVPEEHIFDRLSELGLIAELNKVVTNHLLLSLIMETCYFIQESLLCCLKMRMTVCFTLLRKPFLEISIIIMKLLNESDFIDKFNNVEGFDPIKTTIAEKKILISKTNQLLKNNFDDEDLYDLIFNKEFGNSLFNLTNSAIHLYTDRNPISATEKQNLNLIFGTQENIDDMWEHIYDTIPMLLSFLAGALDELVYKCTDVDQTVFAERSSVRHRMRRICKVG